MSRFSRIVDRGKEEMILYPTTSVINNRGESIKVPSNVGIPVMVNITNDRSSDAELIGQVANKVIKGTMRILPMPVDSWSRVEFRGEVWDLAIPAGTNIFSRNLSHIAFVLRSRNEVVL